MHPSNTCTNKQDLVLVYLLFQCFKGVGVNFRGWGVCVSSGIIKILRYTTLGLSVSLWWRVKINQSLFHWNLYIVPHPQQIFDFIIIFQTTSEGLPALGAGSSTGHRCIQSVYLWSGVQYITTLLQQTYR